MLQMGCISPNLKEFFNHSANAIEQLPNTVV
jgi:hypothetical protein